MLVFFVVNVCVLQDVEVLTRTKRSLESCLEASQLVSLSCHHSDVLVTAYA